jgi:CRISPR-associated endonuclease/helicase Cas3
MESINTIQLIDPEVLSDPHYWAHTRRKAGKDGKSRLETETLLAHSRLTFQYYRIYCRKKEMENVVRDLIEACGFGEEEGQTVYLLFLYSIYLHDLGKINPAYQADVLGNERFRARRRQARNSYHGKASAYLYIDHMHKTVLKNPSEGVYKCLAAFAYCISRHHGALGNGRDFSELELWDERYFQSGLDREVFERIQYDMQQALDGRWQGNEPMAFYILGRLLYALITGCDYCATQEFMTGQAMEPAVIDERGVGLKEGYDGSSLCCSIRTYQKDPASFSGAPINELRTRMFLEAEQHLLARPDVHIYYLEAPTGAGKTNMAINLTLRILELDRAVRNIVYVFPFNTLVEQTKDTLEPYFGGQMAVVNSLTPVLTNKEDGEQEDYEEAWLNHLFHNYPMVLTSHVNFFNALFGCGRDQCFPLLKLCNSVVVLDEIQSYRNGIWREMISFLQIYAKLLHMKIIIMSATLPQLDRMLRTTEAQFAPLIGDPWIYYRDPLFQHRVHLDFSLLERGKITLAELKSKVLEFKGRRVLVEFIKKKTALAFYELCKEECDAVLLTGDDNGARRKQVIERITRGEKLILIATQVIEAGVNIDMKVGFKDISLPDGEEQFMGRINRSCLLPGGGIAYFFDYDDADAIYRGDARLKYSIRDLSIRQSLTEKRFDQIYELVFAELVARTSKANPRNIAYLDRDCVQMNCRNIETAMRLIDPTRQMFIPYRWEELDGYQVWDEFKVLCRNREMGYAQRKVELSRLALKMSYFTFTIYGDKEPPGAEFFGGYYFIEGGEQFVSGGILDREALEKHFEGMFW